VIPNVKPLAVFCCQVTSGTGGAAKLGAVANSPDTKANTKPIENLAFAFEVDTVFSLIDVRSKASGLHQQKVR
jgi:hypothetical protein